VAISQERRKGGGDEKIGTRAEPATSGCDRRAAGGGDGALSMKTVQVHEGGAEIDGPFRYHLWRKLSNVPVAPARSVLFIMLNPSTADETQDDATIRRCLSFSLTWGYERVEVCNLFAFRATDPRQLLTAADPVGPKNDTRITESSRRSSLIVAAWGALPMARVRACQVAKLLSATTPLVCLGLTKGGAPRHPLYVPRDARLTEFRIRHV
jgi:hypothetical protein